MTAAEYHALSIHDMKPRRWRTTCIVRGYWGDIQAGAEVQVAEKRDGLTLKTEPCPCCGVSFSAVRVRPHAIEEITEGDECTRRTEHANGKPR